ncbi:ABC transporter permease [Cetobacterium sp. 2A]|uniref:ABC transporter permease n=2 Tax=Cetobacterium TaxID=180162 RepID=UPI00163BBBEB|nr:ABC transporter permease [Cetobacterium sp. 2A]MBC2857313.1 ABC transporter permease [Cetobacterium sp. 2A]
MTIDISYLSLMFFIITLIPIFFIMKQLNIHLIKSTGISIGRMITQLMFVGLYLQYIFNYNSSLINILYTIVMASIAVYTISKEILLKEFKMYSIIFISVISPLILNLFIFNILILKLENPFDAMYLIPISGMILGNTLNGVIVALNDFLNTFTKNQDEYLFAISLGATKKEAIKPYMAQSIALSIKPNIASMATVGLVSLPGMMTGQILGGSLPIVAIKYQIAIMIAIFTARFFSTYIMMELISKFYFNKYLIFDKRIKNT